MPRNRNPLREAKHFLDKSDHYFSYNYTLFSQHDSTILFFVRYAGPFDLLESYIRKAYARKELNLSLILSQGIERAVVNLDQTIYDNHGKIIDKGMAEKLLELYLELFQSTYLQALQQAKNATPQEDKKIRQQRETRNVIAIQNVFSGFTQNNKHITRQAIYDFENYLKKIRHKIKNDSDNIYHKNIIHLLYVAFNILHSANLPENKIADFCHQIIESLLLELPERVKQILKSGFYEVMKNHKPIERYIDSSGEIFRDLSIEQILGMHSAESETDTFLFSHNRIKTYAQLFHGYYEQLNKRPNFPELTPPAPSPFSRGLCCTIL